MNISNPIVANAIQSRVARNMLTSRQYAEIYHYLDNEYTHASRIEDCIKGVADNLADVRMCGRHVTEAYDDEAKNDQQKIEKEVAACYAILKNLAVHKRRLLVAIHDRQKKYSTYDPKRLID